MTNLNYKSRIGQGIGIALIIFLAISCTRSVTEEGLSDSAYSFYLGTYTNGESEGIYKGRLLENGKMVNLALMTEAKNPSFLALSGDRKYLLATNAVDIEGTGVIESYKIGKDTLQFLSRQISGGSNPCYITVNDSGIVLTANYGGGNISLHQLDADGALSDLIESYNHTGNGNHSRQEGPHAHSVQFDPYSNTIIAADLGTNDLWFYQLDSNSLKLEPKTQQKLSMKSEAGPRHFSFHPNALWIYVLNELDNTITKISKNNEGIYETESSINTLPSNFTEFSKSADIHISSDGNFLYSSNRGHNSIAIFSIDKEIGTLKFLAHESTRGTTPRNFSISPNENFLIVANRESDNLVSFKRDNKTGLLEFVDELEAPTPVCIVFE